jgi:hypothetical protein
MPQQPDPDSLRRRQQELIRRRRAALGRVHRLENELDVVACLLDRVELMARPTLLSGPIVPFRGLRGFGSLKS